MSSRPRAAPSGVVVGGHGEVCLVRGGIKRQNGFPVREGSEVQRFLSEGSLRGQKRRDDPVSYSLCRILGQSFPDRFRLRLPPLHSKRPPASATKLHHVCQHAHASRLLE